MLVAAAVQAQAFGRFGYAESVDIPGFEVDRNGFRVRQDRADRFSYEVPAARWRALLTSELSQTVSLGARDGNPEKARFDLLGTGFSLYFRAGLALKLSSNSAPYLTWEEGSAGPGVPTPKVGWLLVSFRDAQPPVLFSLMGGKRSFILSGRSGNWTLRSEDKVGLWVRVNVPIGLEPKATNSAAALGELTQRVKRSVKYYVDPVPQLTDLQVREDETGVVAKWIFDRPFAVVPLAALLAPLGGYPLRMSSATIRIDSTDRDGPTSVLVEKEMTVRFPVQRIPTGRALTLGMPSADPPGTVSSIDVQGVSELALLNLLAARDELARESAEAIVSRYLSEVHYTTEPHSNQRLPFGEDGAGIDLAAAQALLMQATISTVKATSEPNSLLTSVRWRRDWRTWRIWTPDEALSVRAGALASLAAALCPEPMRRLDAGMLEAGLATRRGLEVWRTRSGHSAAADPPPGPFEGLRRAVFNYRSRSEDDGAFLSALRSEIRVYGSRQVWAESVPGGMVIRWMAEDAQPMSLILASAYPVTAEAKTNLASAATEDALGFTVIRCTPAERGICEMILKAPEWASPLPAYVEPPRFRS